MLALLSLVKLILCTCKLSLPDVFRHLGNYSHRMTDLGWFVVIMILQNARFDFFDRIVLVCIQVELKVYQTFFILTIITFDILDLTVDTDLTLTTA